MLSSTTWKNMWIKRNNCQLNEIIVNFRHKNHIKQHENHLKQVLNILTI